MHNCCTPEKDRVDTSRGQDELGRDESYDDIFNSPSAEDSFQHTTLIATLAERFSLTSFKPFQKTIIDAALDGQDTLVIHPTGSGKSLCFQFSRFISIKRPLLLHQQLP